MPQSEQVRTFVVIDGLNLFFRNHARLHHLSRSDGTQSGAFYGTARSIIALLNEFKPHYFVFVWDGVNAKEHRQSLDADYKSNRPKDRNSAVGLQMAAVVMFLEWCGLPQINIDHLEADDVLSQLAFKVATDLDVNMVLVTEDHDMYQCLRPNVSIYKGMKKEMFTEAQFIEWNDGLMPWQYPAVQAITGCSTDNVYGIHGIGEKTARKMVLKYDTLGETVDSEDRLREYKDQIFKNYQIVKHDAVSLDVPYEKSAFTVGNGVDEEFMRPLLQQWDMKQMLGQFENRGWQLIDR